jgi:hypothetical protein
MPTTVLQNSSVQNLQTTSVQNLQITSVQNLQTTSVQNFQNKSFPIQFPMISNCSNFTMNYNILHN